MPIVTIKARAREIGKVASPFTAGVLAVLVPIVPKNHLLNVVGIRNKKKWACIHIFLEKRGSLLKNFDDGLFAARTKSESLNVSHLTMTHKIHSENDGSKKLLAFSKKPR